MFRMKVVATLSVVTLILFPDMAVAGPLPTTVTWTYSSDYYSTRGGFYLADKPLTTVYTESGQQSYILPYADYGPKDGKIDEQFGLRYGPVAAYITITDVASGASAKKTIEYVFYERGGQILTELFEPRPQEFTLGEHEYLLTAAGNYQGLNVKVSDVVGVVHATPEPATLAIAGIGLALIGVMRFKRNK